MQVYCNVEGVAWLDSSRLVLTSDRSKKTQVRVCRAEICVCAGICVVLLHACPSARGVQVVYIYMCTD